MTGSAVVAFATQGPESLDDRRLRALLRHVDAEFLAVDRSRKLRSALTLRSQLRTRQPPLVVMEGTGIAGGLALLSLPRVRYLVSSGDAVGPYLARRGRVVGAFARVYERLLMRRSAGFVGWTPYLVGRALTLGAPAGLTAPGWSRDTPDAGARARGRERIGVPEDAIVFGLVGSLSWTPSVGYAQGLELVRAIRRTSRPDIRVCVVGEGSGRRRLVEEAGDDGRVLLPGAVPPEAVGDILASFDVGSLPQSVDEVGSFRYGTKLPEYLAAGLPVVTGRVPFAYDLDEGWLWRMPGRAPWDEAYVAALAALMTRVTPEEIGPMREAATRAAAAFDAGRQSTRVAEFITELIA